MNLDIFIEMITTLPEVIESGGQTFGTFLALVVVVLAVVLIVVFRTAPPQYSLIAFGMLVVACIYLVNVPIRNAYVIAESRLTPPESPLVTMVTPSDDTMSGQPSKSGAQDSQNEDKRQILNAIIETMARAFSYSDQSELDNYRRERRKLEVWSSGWAQGAGYANVERCLIQILRENPNNGVTDKANAMVGRLARHVNAIIENGMKDVKPVAGNACKK